MDLYNELLHLLQHIIATIIKLVKIVRLIFIYILSGVLIPNKFNPCCKIFAVKEQILILLSSYSFFCFKKWQILIKTAI